MNNFYFLTNAVIMKELLAPTQNMCYIEKVIYQSINQLFINFLARPLIL